MNDKKEMQTNGHAGDGANAPVDMSNGGHDTTTKVTGRAATRVSSSSRLRSRQIHA